MADDELTIDEVTPNRTQDFDKIRNKAEDESDAGFYVCLVFQSNAQKNSFLRNLSLDEEAVIDKTYIDGQLFAEAFNVDVPQNRNPPLHDKINKKRQAMAMDNS